MSSTSEPVHLSNHHRNTLRQIFEHPVSHNVEWRTVVSLLEAVGSVVERHDGKVAVTVGSQTEFFDPPPHKDIDIQAVVDLRRMLSAAGYSTASTDVLLWLTRSSARTSRIGGQPGPCGGGRERMRPEGRRANDIIAATGKFAYLFVTGYIDRASEHVLTAYMRERDE